MNRIAICKKSFTHNCMCERDCGSSIEFKIGCKYRIDESLFGIEGQYGIYDDIKGREIDLSSEIIKEYFIVL